MRQYQFFIGIIFVFQLFISVSFSEEIQSNLVITEILYGGVNAADEFIEIYNPNDEPINLQDLGLKLHIRNSSGSTDSNKTIEWIREEIPAHGYFLFVSKMSESYLELADASYSASLVNNGAVYISKSSSALTEVLDFIAWGTHILPEEFTEVFEDSFSTQESIQRNLEEDTFSVNTNPDPKNSLNNEGSFNDEISDELIVIQEITEDEGLEEVEVTQMEELQDLQITEVLYGGESAYDEFVEIYNPNNQAIHLQNFGLKLHIRNSTGSTDSNKTIEWIREEIPAHGYFLFVSKTSNYYLPNADAIYSASLVDNGAVYIAKNSSALTEVLDFISWGTHVLPVGFENQSFINGFTTKQSLEKDFAGNFEVSVIPEAINSLSEIIFGQENTAVSELKSSKIIVNEPSLQNVLFESVNQYQEESNIFISQLSLNDSKNDWIELSCTNCESEIFVSGFRFYDNTFFFRFPDYVSVQENKPLKLFLVKELQENDDQIFFVEKSRGLTKTDDQLFLLNTQNQIVDALCWSDFNQTLSQRQKDEEENLRRSNAWKNDCINSQELNKKDALLMRNNFTDTNTKEDWAIVSQKINDVEELKLEEKTETIIEKDFDFSSLKISEIFVNPKGTDTGKEWIEFKNISENLVNLKYWKIFSESKQKSFIFPDQTIEAGEFFVLKDLSFSLKNSSDILELRSFYDEVQQKIEYTKVYENKSFAIDSKGRFVWTEIQTPEQENKIFIVKDQLTKEEKKDSDFDGLTDVLEQKLGTNIFSRDTDNDLLSDLFELENNLDPLMKNEGKTEDFKSFLKEKVEVKISIPQFLAESDKEEVLKIYGSAEPFSKVKIFVHSDLHLFVTSADKNGKWEYEVPQLEKGEHHYQTQVFDKSGLALELSDPVVFYLKEDFKAKDEKILLKNQSTKALKSEVKIINKKGQEILNKNFVSKIFLKPQNTSNSFNAFCFYNQQKSNKNIAYFLLVFSFFLVILSCFFKPVIIAEKKY